MPAYDWTCQKCGASVPKQHGECQECGCPAYVSALELSGKVPIRQVTEKLQEPNDSALGEAYDELSEVTVGGIRFLPVILITQLLGILAWELDLPDQFSAPRFLWYLVYAAIVVPFVGVLYVGITSDRPLDRRIQMVLYSGALILFFVLTW